jgi:OHCU decarboxylase
MIVIGVIPKVGAIVAAIPPPVLGGAGFALFGTVAVVGVQTLRRVDFHEESNVIILAISLGFAIAPTVYPTIVSGFSQAVQTVLSSGITLGSLSAILLNIVFNVWGGKGGLVRAVLPVPRRPETLTIDQVNAMSREQFVREFGGLFQGPPWVAEQAYEARPFADLYDLRKAFDTVLFDAPEEQQLALIRSYPDLGRVAQRQAEDSVFPSLSVMDQAAAGLDRLSRDEHQTFDELTTAYRERFGFPLVIAVRENTKESILRQGNSRLNNAPVVEQATALVEIAKIANLRLLDRVEESTPEPVEA